MPVKLSERVREMKESETLAMAQLGRDLQARGLDIINLSLGEPDFDTPSHIKAAAVEALDEGYTKYSPVPGLPELRKAISEKFQKENDLDYSPEQIVVSNGAKQSISNICYSLLDPGDEVILFSPYWVSYDEIIRLAGGIPVELKTGIDQDFKPTPEQLEEVITQRTKLILYSSPCNPTGSVFSEGELKALAEVINRNDKTLVISDEIYEYINFTSDHHSIGAVPGMIDRTITVNGFSKGFAMTGWRLGYMGAPLKIAKACSKMQSQSTSGANTFGQKAAVTALTADKAPTHQMEATFLQRRDLIVELIADIPSLKSNNPEGAFYIFPDCSALYGKKYKKHHINNSAQLCHYLLEEALVATVPGSAFGNDDCIRMSYAASEDELTEAIKRIKKAIERLA